MPNDANHEKNFFELDFDALLVQEAKNGNRSSAIRVLSELADSDPRTSLSPTLLSYLFECLRSWRDLEFDARGAAIAFHVIRPKHRPNDSPFILAKRIRALRCYLLMRGRGKGRNEAVRIAAISSNLSESSIKQLLEREAGFLTVERAAALLQIPKRLRNRCLAPPRKKHQRTR
jgi:hypothetical protein